mgnify:CR=1 FL=1|jgi:hypothetical protein
MKYYHVITPEGISICTEDGDCGESVVAFVPAETYDDLPYGAAYQSPEETAKKILDALNN